MKTTTTTNNNLYYGVQMAKGTPKGKKNKDVEKSFKDGANVAELKELRPGVLGTPGVFSKELLDSLPMNYKSPPGDTYKFDSKKGLKKVQKKTKRKTKTA